MHLVLVLAQAAVDVLLLAHALDVQVHRGVSRRVGREGGLLDLKPVSKFEFQLMNMVHFYLDLYYMNSWIY